MSGARVPVLMYHALEARRSVISISPHLFAWQMEWLHANGYSVIPLSQLIHHLVNKVPLPNRSVVITFDDGFESVYTVAFPILARLQFPATVFLVPSHCGGANDWPDQPQDCPQLSLLNWSQIREMDKYGIDFGAHTLNHLRLDKVESEALEQEVMGSKIRIEDNLGHAIQHFAYPYGRLNKRVKSLVGQAFAGACSTRLGLVGSASDSLALERVDAYYLQHRMLFKQIFRGIFQVYLSIRRPMRSAASVLLRRAWSSQAQHAYLCAFGSIVPPAQAESESLDAGTRGDNAQTC